VESVRERLRSEVELRVKAFLDEQRVDWEKRIDELLKEIKDRYFISLIEERLKGLISTVDSLERRVRELELRPVRLVWIDTGIFVFPLLASTLKFLQNG